MTIETLTTKEACGQAAAAAAAALLKDALARKSTVRFIAATGASQFDMLAALCTTHGIDWSRCEMFHLDEYVGLDASHPASFRRYLRERLVERVHPGRVHFIAGDVGDPQAEARRLGAEIAKAPIDLALVGVGENGHLAFNDPPADFAARDAYLVLDLDHACRVQQVGEGWFATVDDVPARAISMSIPQIMKSEAVICTVPDRRKAQAVFDCLSPSAAVDPAHPASILRTHRNVSVFLDRESASLMSP